MTIKRYLHLTQPLKPVIPNEFNTSILKTAFNPTGSNHELYKLKLNNLNRLILSLPKPQSNSNLTLTIKDLLIKNRSRFDQPRNDNANNDNNKTIRFKYENYQLLKMETIKETKSINKLASHLIRTKLNDEYPEISQKRRLIINEKFHSNSLEIEQIQNSRNYNNFLRSLYNKQFNKCKVNGKSDRYRYYKDLESKYLQLPQPAPIYMKHEDLEFFIRQVMYLSKINSKGNNSNKFQLKILNDFQKSGMFFSFRELIKILNSIIIVDDKLIENSKRVYLIYKKNQLLANDDGNKKLEFFNCFLDLVRFLPRDKDEFVSLILKDMNELNVEMDRFTYVTLLRIMNDGMMQQQQQQQLQDTNNYYKKVVLIDLIEKTILNNPLDLEIIDVIRQSLTKLKEGDVCRNLMVYYIDCFNITGNQGEHHERESLYEKDLAQYRINIRLLNYLTSLNDGCINSNYSDTVKNNKGVGFSYVPEASIKLVNGYLYHSEDMKLYEKLKTQFKVKQRTVGNDRKFLKIFRNVNIET